MREDRSREWKRGKQGMNVGEEKVRERIAERERERERRRGEKEEEEKKRESV